jgi:hypothetical protein
MTVDPCGAGPQTLTMSYDDGSAFILALPEYPGWPAGLDSVRGSSRPAEQRGAGCARTSPQSWPPASPACCNPLCWRYPEKKLNIVYHNQQFRHPLSVLQQFMSKIIYLQFLILPYPTQPLNTDLKMSYHLGLLVLLSRFLPLFLTKCRTSRGKGKLAEFRQELPLWTGAPLKACHFNVQKINNLK